MAYGSPVAAASKRRRGPGLGPRPRDTGAIAAAQGHIGHGTSALTVVGTDYAFDGPESIEAGYVSLTFSNAGIQPHHVQLARLNDGISIEQAVAAMRARGAGFGQGEGPPE